MKTAEYLFNRQQFLQQLRRGEDAQLLFRRTIADIRLSLKNSILGETSITSIIKYYSHAIDDLLIAAWRYHNLDSEQTICLLAIGGYGRAELQPYSDIDVLIFIPENLSTTNKQRIEKYIRFLWDMGLQVGHSIRTLNETIIAAKQDITIISNLMETRLLSGDREVYPLLQEAMQPDKIWPSNKFFQAKWREQKLRYKRYGDSDYTRAVYVIYK